jgi:hypothetical protein
VSATLASRLLRCALALALLASGGLHFHADDPSPGGHWNGAAGGSGDLFRSAASHPQAPVHMERVAVERAPRCHVCLLRERNAAIELAVASFAAAEPDATPIASAPTSLLLRRAGDPGRPRGPPRA